MSLARDRHTSQTALAAAVVLALSACSSSAPDAKTTSAKASAGSSSSAPVATSTTAASATALFEQLRKSGAAAKSVRIKGSIANGSITSKAVKVQVDIAGDRAGKNMRAMVNDGTGAIEILTAGGQTYLKADTAYWTKNGSAAVAKLAAGKYIKVPAGSSAGIGGLTVGKLLDQIFAKDISTAGKVNTNVTKTEVGGVPAYVMTTKVDDMKIYVSADGKARLMRVEGSKGQQTTLDFTQWNTVPPASAPPADQLANIPGL
jgi:hypothetical protein